MPKQVVTIKKKRIVLGAVIGAIILAAGILLALWNGTFLSKADKILLAAARTQKGSQLAEELQVTDWLTEDYTMEADTTLNHISVTASFASTKEVKTLTANLGISLLDDKIKTTSVLENGVLKVQIPLVSKDVFRYSYQDFDEEEQDNCLTSLFSETQIEKANELLELLSETEAEIDEETEQQKTEAMIEQFRSLHFTKAETESFEVNGKERKCKGYTTELTTENYLAFLEGLNTIERQVLSKQLKTVENWPDCAVTFYIGGKQLAAIRIQTEETNVVIEFLGTDAEKVESIVVSDEEETLLDVTYHEEDGVFKIKSGKYHSVSISGTLTKSEEQLKLNMDDFKWGKKEGTVSLKLTKGAVCAQLESGGEELDLGTMTKEEFEQAFWKIIWMKNGGIS